MELILALNSFKIFSTATFRTNLWNGCALLTEKDLKKQGRGSFDYRTDVNTGLHLVKWFDNKCVHLALAFSGVKGEKTVQRWGSKKKQHIQVQCPHIVASYKASVGGFDLADMLIALYCAKIMTNKRWYLKIIFHIVDICKVSGRLLYRRPCKQNSIASKHQMSLLSFVTDVFLALCQSSKPVLLGRKKRSYSLSPPKVCKKPTLPKPVLDVRHNLIDHFPELTGKIGRCRFCPMGYNYVICNKCRIILCLR